MHAARGLSKAAIWGTYVVVQSPISLSLGGLFSVAFSSPFEVLVDNTPKTAITLIFDPYYPSFAPRRAVPQWKLSDPLHRFHLLIRTRGHYQQHHAWQLSPRCISSLLSLTPTEMRL